MEKQHGLSHQSVLGREVMVRRERISDQLLALYLYFDGIDRLVNVSGSDLQFFLVWIALYLRKEDGIINMGDDRRAEMCEIFGFKEDMYYRRLHNLIEGEIIERLGVHQYKVNSWIVTVTRPVKKTQEEWLRDMPVDEVSRETEEKTE